MRGLRTTAHVCFFVAAVATVASLTACNGPQPMLPSDSGEAQQAAPPGPRDADTGFTPRGAAQRSAVPAPQPRALVLSILMVRVPPEQMAAADAIWRHLRENALDAQTQLSLRQNGLRVGVGSEQSWEAVQAALEGIEERRVTDNPPVELRPDTALGIELDSAPRDQTLFYVNRDGILTGQTWRGSRTILRIYYSVDARRPERVVLRVSPAVEQQKPGEDWSRDPSGAWTPAPSRTSDAIAAVSFVVGVGPGEFVVLGPSEAVRVPGLLGGALLTTENEGQRAISYLFLKPELKDVRQRSD